MPINYTPSGTYPSFPIALPKNGEVLSETTFTVAILEPIIDAIGTNAARSWSAAQTFALIQGSGTPAYNVSSRSEPRVRPLNWQIDSGFTFTGERWVDAGTLGVMSAVIELPHGQTLEEITIWIDPAAHAFLPATPPQFVFESVVVGTAATPTTIDTVADTSSLGTYQTYHALTMTGLSTVIDAATKAYRIVFTGEGGLNSAANLQAYGWVQLTYTRTSIGED